MSKPFTSENFEDHLNSGLAWRRAEIAALVANLEKTVSPGSTDTPLSRALSRSVITMLYAHWEGYTKSAFSSYSKFLIGREIKLSSANDSLAYAHLEKQLHKARAGNDAARADLLGVIRSESDPKISLDRSAISDTKSNLRFDTLSEILDRVGATDSQFSGRKHLINSTICDQRNSIAHGRETFPAPTAVIALSKEVIKLLEDVRGVLVELVQESKFLRETS